jgi:hypothetical protein
MTTLREDIERAASKCDAMFAAKGEIISFYDVTIADGTRGIIADPGHNPEVMREVFEALDVVRYLRLGEAWTLRQSVSETEYERWHGRLHDHPNRVEIVTIIGEDANEGQIMASREIIRTAIGPPTLGPLVFNMSDQLNGAKITNLSGRLIGMLPNRGTVQ